MNLSAAFDAADILCTAVSGENWTKGWTSHKRISHSLADLHENSVSKINLFARMMVKYASVSSMHSIQSIKKIPFLLL